MLHRVECWESRAQRLMLFEFGEGILQQLKDRVRNYRIESRALLQRLTMPSDNRVLLRCVPYILGHGLFFSPKSPLLPWSSKGPLQMCRHFLSGTSALSVFNSR